MSGYTYLSGLLPDPSMQKMVTAVAIGAGMYIVGRMAVRGLRDAGTLEAAVIPAPRPNLLGAVDFCLESFLNYHDSVLGRENRKHVPFTASIFFFLLLSNLLGLVPGVPAVTTTVWINVGLAIVVFLYFNISGIIANGLWGYLKHFAGPIWWLSFFLFPLEIFSTFLRILTLNLRLYWNITADHLVLEIFTGLLGPVLPMVLYVLGTFVSFMQAFVFTTLTMVYILLATQHSEGDHAENVHGDGAHGATGH